MSVAISLTTTNTSHFSFSPHPYSILPPLSSSFFSINLSQPSDHPPLSYPFDSLFVRTSMLPTGKAHQEDLRRLFTKPGPHIFKDATIPITFVGDPVVEFLLCPPSSFPLQFKTLEISFLLSKAISVCTKSQLDNLLRIAVLSGNSDYVSALIDVGGDVNTRGCDGRSMLSIPVETGNLDVVSVLIDSGCRMNESIDLFLHNAAETNRVDLMEILCRNGDSVKLVNSVNSVGRSPIHVAAIKGNMEALRYCVSMNGNPDCVDYKGWTPLHCAAAEGHVEIVEYLLECSLYSKHAINEDGKTPFLVAVENGHESSHLLDLLHLNDALHRAAKLDDVNGIKSCIEQGAKVNGRDQNGWTPIHRAAFKGRIESVKALLSYGAQLDLVDDLGYTPLHCAIEAGQTEVALYLIAHGARGNLKSVQAVCPLNFDGFKNHPAFVSPLCGKMEKV
ncbi:Serine/threonine-protein phosphatase 6 regulatory ankyrin repeat subunit B [Thalictrum thalictroides]|uniref:Serine/threonine-protein phosphatase 6 regulatory ankyrin repeat subunit B n=1 Tax=Thalictrum thalictroides TaxID=46969 RepID=A0A7J6VMC5_THATH|nr:Serine/threonine-protein phosphatase 6 regulatory ankyrin repeat subunit B [Thalictrum thalictroides]